MSPTEQMKMAMQMSEAQSQSAVPSQAMAAVLLREHAVALSGYQQRTEQSGHCRPVRRRASAAHRRPRQEIDKV